MPLGKSDARRELAQHEGVDGFEEVARRGESRHLRPVDRRRAARRQGVFSFDATLAGLDAALLVDSSGEVRRRRRGRMRAAHP